MLTKCSYYFRLPSDVAQLTTTSSVVPRINELYLRVRGYATIDDKLK